MRAILIPVKNFREAKKRLAPHFSPSARAALSEALLDDFIRLVAGVRGIDRVIVVSSEPVALERARANGWQTIAETDQRSESDSVDAASRLCAEQGVHALLRVPVDIPLAQAVDIEAIFDGLDNAAAAVLVPSRDGTGTNALLRTPPTLFPSHFGPNSFEKHLAEIRSRAARLRILRNPRLELDVDDLDDLLDLRGKLSQASSMASWMLAQGLCVEKSLAAAATDARPASADR